MADRFPEQTESDLTYSERWSNDKTIIELGYRKISLFVRASQIN